MLDTHKGLLFTCIPHGLNNPHSWLPFHYQSRIINILRAIINVLPHSMSYHRVLPPPSPFTEPPVSRADSLLQSRIMTEKGRVIDQRSSPRTLHSDGISTRKRRSSLVDRESLEDYKESPKILLANKSAHISNGVGDTSPKSLPPIRKPSVVSWSGELPSQVCLCQPDPKVPRPRNGKLV